jgi:hypothetical protein
MEGRKGWVWICRLMGELPRRTRSRVRVFSAELRFAGNIVY